MKPRFAILITAIFLLALGGILFLYNPPERGNVDSSNWDTEYSIARTQANIPNKYVESTYEFDYNAPEIHSIVEEFKTREYKNIEELIEGVGSYSYNKLNYNPNSTYDDCLVSSASEIAIREEGLCSTMSKVDIAILRGLGIASRPVTGCVYTSDNESCVPLSFQKARLQSALGFERQRKTEKIEVEDGIVVSKGGLHTWVEVWIPERGWTILEATTGYLVDYKCEEYIRHKEEANTNEICGLTYLTNKDFIDKCEVME